MDKDFLPKKNKRVFPVWISLLMGFLVALILAVRIAESVEVYDIWWHMALGREILSSGSLISDHSLFTWTPAEAYRVYNAWIAQVSLYLLYDWGGTGALLALRYLIFFIFFFLGWHYAVQRQVATHPLAWLIILLGVMIVWPAYLIKPELFTVGFMTITVWLYFHVRSAEKAPAYLYYLLPLTVVVWANTHGAFAVVSLLFAAAALGELLNLRFSRSQAMPAKMRLHFLAALVLCIPAVFVNPYGYELPLHILQGATSGGTGYDVRTMGFWPTFLFNAPPHYMLDYMIAAMTVFVFLVWQKIRNKETDWVVILMFLGYCALYTKYARLTLFLAPVFTFVCLDLLSAKDRSWAWPVSPVLKWATVAVSLSFTALIGWRTVESQWCDVSRGFAGITVVNNQPVAETEYIKNNLSGSKIGNMYRDGGYLIYHLVPDKKVLIDTRNFPFKAWIEDYFEFQFARNIPEFVDKMDADYWLVNYYFDEQFIWFMKSDAWDPVFLGPVGAVFVPSGTAHTELEIADNLDSIFTYDILGRAFNAALQLDDLDFARRLYQVAIANFSGLCGKDKDYKVEMKSVLDGYEAFNRGDLLGAYGYLNRDNQYLIVQDKVLRTLELLAHQARINGKLDEAWGWSEKALEYPMHIATLYNFMLIDWQISRTSDFIIDNRDKFRSWKVYADLILANRDKVDEKYKFVVDTAEAMNAAEYSGTGKLISRFGLPMDFRAK